MLNHEDAIGLTFATISPTHDLIHYCFVVVSLCFDSLFVHHFPCMFCPAAFLFDHSMCHYEFQFLSPQNMVVFAVLSLLDVIETSHTECQNMANLFPYLF